MKNQQQPNPANSRFITEIHISDGRTRFFGATPTSFNSSNRKITNKGF